MKYLFTASAIVFILLSAFTPRKKNKPRLPEEYILIPAGSYYTATPEQDPYYYGRTKKIQAIDSGKIKSIGSFYISKYEVSNQQYRQFYNEVAPLLPENEKAAITCDSLGWRETLSYGEPFVEYYYRHPAYNNYPVVNITYQGATKYCEWLQQKIQQDNPDFEIEVRLPEKYEWTWAAMGGRRQAIYPWGNFYLRNKKGEFLCNFKRVGDESIVRNRKTGQPEVIATNGFPTSGTAFYTAPVKSFYPNDYGLYNMCGNVSEMITEKGIAMGGSWNDYGGDITTKSESGYTDFLPSVGFRPVITATPKTVK